MKAFTAVIGAAGTKIISMLATLMAVNLIAYSSFVLYDSVYTNRMAFASSDLAQYRPVIEEEEPTFEEIQTVNSDTSAWVIMTDTHIDYPVVQGKDDVEYANKDIYGKSSLTGSIYLAKDNDHEFTDSVNMIYGHHMDNGAMFGDIEKYADDSYFYSHQDGILMTTRGAYDIRIMGMLSADAYDSYLYATGDRPASDFPDYLHYLKSLAIQWDSSADIDGITKGVQSYIDSRDRNIAENGVFTFSKMPEDEVLNGTQIIAFSTCADATTNGRQVLVGTMKFRTEPISAAVTIADNAVPMAAWGHGEAEHWSLLNAICTVMAILATFPGKALRKKYISVTETLRKKHNKQKKLDLKDFGEAKIVGFLGQVMLSAFAVFWFMWTQNPIKPMVIVDKWTLGFIAMYAAVWVIDAYVIKNYKRDASRIRADMQGNNGAAALAI